MIVVDASVIVELLLPTRAGLQLAERLFAEGESLHAPHLLDLEVAQVIRRYHRGREITADRGALILQDLIDLPLTRYPHDLLLARIWALRDNLTAYDAAYVALAEALQAPLLTRDRRLAATRGHKARMEVV